MDNLNSNIDFIKKSPKTELHLHIEGSLEPELMFKLSKKSNSKYKFYVCNSPENNFMMSNGNDF